MYYTMKLRLSLDLEKYLIKPSSAEYIRREIVLAEAISGNPINLVGQTIIKSTDSETKDGIYLK